MAIRAKAFQPAKTKAIAEAKEVLQAYNDYIFAVICEELGLVGAVLIIALFAALILRGFWIALHAQDRFSTVLAAGLVTLIAVQTVLNMCVVTNLLPSTGIALPFFSYGGTALAVNMGEMGVVLSISRQRNQTKKQEEILLLFSKAGHVTAFGQNDDVKCIVAFFKSVYLPRKIFVNF